MLDTLAVMSAQGLWTTQHCPDADMCTALNESVPVSITYTSGSEVNLNRRDADVETGLAMRILYAFFIDSDVMSFPTFCELLPKGTCLDAVQAVTVCLVAAERETGAPRGVLLLVDELVKLLHAKPDAQLLAILGSLLDTFSSSQLNLVCTTLDAVMLKAKVASTGRSIIWAPLPAIRQADAEVLILSALKAAEPGLQSLPTAVRITISDAAGHPRSLQFVLESLLQLDKSEREDLLVLRDAVLTRVNTSAVPVPALDAVEAALRGVPLPLRSLPIKDDTRDLRTLITDGVFINTDVPADLEAKVVPKLSMLRLLLYARTYDHASSDVRGHAAARCVSFMAYEKASGVIDALRSTLAGKHFEHFVARWLQLMSIIRGDETISVLDLFHAEQLKDHGPSDALTHTFKLGSVVWRDPCPGNFMDALAHGSKRDCHSVVIMVMSNDNPAFDALMTAPCGDSKPATYVAIAVETRISDVGSPRTDDPAKSNSKLDFFEGHLDCYGDQLPAGVPPGGVRSLFQRMDPAPAHVAYVYAAARLVPGIAADQKKRCSDGILLLGNACQGEAASLATVQRAFTVTLADRAVLLLNLHVPTASAAP